MMAIRFNSLLRKSSFRLLIAATAPLLILLFLLELQALFGVLRYFNPLARYIFIAAIAIVAFDAWRGKRPNLNRLSPWWTGVFDSKTLPVAAFSLMTALCLLVLLISWSNGGTQDYSAIGGLLPYSDAAGYYEGAQRLLYDAHLTEWTERRPLNAAFLAARLLITGNNFYGALIIQALLAAVAVFLATSAIFQTHGKTVALLFFAISFAFISCCLHRTLSEPLGISLGLIALALCWSGIANVSLTLYALGTSVLALALLARAGAMFALPASVLFASIFFSESWQKRVTAGLATIAAIGAAWIVNSAIIKLYGTSSGAFLSNFSYVIYGLSQGTANWTQALTEFPQLAGMDEARAAAFLYQKTIDSIISTPSLLISGLAKAFASSVVMFPLHFMRLLADGSDGGSPWKKAHLIIACVIILPVLAFRVFKIKKPKFNTLDRFHLFLFLQLLGFLASLPFFYHDGGIRLTAATFPIIAALIALVVSNLTASSQTPDHAFVNGKLATIVAIAATAFVVIASVSAPRISLAMGKTVTADAERCGSNEEKVQIGIGEGSAHINIVDNLRSSFAPNVQQRDFLISKSNERAEEWQSLLAPTTILTGFDIKSRSLRQISGPAGFADGPSRIALLCATPLPKSIFSYEVKSRP